MESTNPHIRAQALYAGLAAVEFAALTQLLGRETLSCWLHTSVICFAVSVPGLVLCSIKRIGTDEGETEEHVYADLALLAFWLVSLLAGLLGLACLFAHFRPAYGAVFAVSAAAAALGIRHLTRRRTKR